MPLVLSRLFLTWNPWFYLGRLEKRKRKALYVCVWIPCSRLRFAFHAFFFFFLFSPQLLTSQLWTIHLCIVHESHKLHFSVTFSLKMGPTVLFTHLKIISLSFQFQQNKFYPNGPYVLQKKKKYIVYLIVQSGDPVEFLSQFSSSSHQNQLFISRQKTSWSPREF